VRVASARCGPCRSVSTELVERWAAALSARAVDRLAELFTADCLYEDVTFAAVQHGRDELIAFGRGFLAGVPDFAIELSSVFADGARAAAEWTMHGTHTGDLPELPSTGRRGPGIGRDRPDAGRTTRIPPRGADLHPTAVSPRMGGGVRRTSKP
jgi:steroid delta-isomerase-like uncharacterized protein